MKTIHPLHKMMLEEYDDRVDGIVSFSNLTSIKIGWCLNICEQCLEPFGWYDYEDNCKKIYIKIGEIILVKKNKKYCL